MFTKEKNCEKICSFYASDYHLEMIMIPYINKKIEEQVNVRIITERKLAQTAKDVILKINLPENKKNELLKLDWNNNSIENVRKNEKTKENVIFIIGNQNYIEEKNKELNKMQNETQKLKIVNCYSIEDVQDNIAQIVANHSKILNTTEEKEIG